MGITEIFGLSTQLSVNQTNAQQTRQSVPPVQDAASRSGNGTMENAVEQTDTVNISELGYAQSQAWAAMSSEETSADASYLDEAKMVASSRVTLKNSMNNTLESSMESSLDKIAQDAFWYGSPGMRNMKLLQDIGGAFKGVFKDLQDNVDQQIAAAQTRGEGTADATTPATTAAAQEGATTDAAPTPEGNGQAAPQTSAANAATEANTDQAPNPDVAVALAQVAMTGASGDAASVEGTPVAQVVASTIETVSR